MAFGLGAFVATDAGANVPLAWYGTAVSILILTLGLAADSIWAVQLSIALLGALLLLRHEDRLVLAPVYGAGVLLVGELAQRSLELRGQGRLGPGVIASRLAACLVLAGLGACGAAVAAIAVTIAPARTVAFTAVGTIAALVAFGAIVVLARRHRS